jgi:hypothetical protein
MVKCYLVTVFNSKYGPFCAGVAVYSDALYRPHELAHTASPFGARPRGPPCARQVCRRRLFQIYFGSSP